MKGLLVRECYKCGEHSVGLIFSEISSGNIFQTLNALVSHNIKIFFFPIQLLKSKICEDKGRFWNINRFILITDFLLKYQKNVGIKVVKGKRIKEYFYHDLTS